MPYRQLSSDPACADALDSPRLDDRPVATIASLPDELLEQIASHLLAPPLSDTQKLLHGTFIGGFQDTTENDVDSWDHQLNQPRRRTIARELPPLRDLSSLRLVDRRLELVACGLLFGRVQVPTVERLEWISRRPHLAKRVRWLDVLGSALLDKGSTDQMSHTTGPVLEVVTREMPALRCLTLQSPLPATIINSLRPSIGRLLHLDGLTDLALVLQASQHDPIELLARRHVLRLPPILPFLSLHPQLRTLHISGCQLSASHLGSFASSLASAGIRLETLSIEVTSRLDVGFEDVLLQRLKCLMELGNGMGRSLSAVRLFGEHAEYGANKLHEDINPLIPQLGSLQALRHLNLDFAALDLCSPLVASVVKRMVAFCPALEPSCVYWEEEKLGLEETHTSMVNFYSHRLGRTWVSAAAAAVEEDESRPNKGEASPQSVVEIL